MGLHVDIDQVFLDNMAKKGVTRKYGCVIINSGDKLTAEQKTRLQIENQEKYGLTQKYIDYLKLPKASNVKVYDIGKIVKSKRMTTTVEKIVQLQEMYKALLDKLSILNSGQTIDDLNYLSP